MRIIFPDEGLLYALQRLADGSGAGLFWKLFTNDVTPDVDSVIGDFTFASATWAEIQVPLSAFTSQVVAAHQGSIMAQPITFTNTSGGTVALYGYCVLDPTKAFVIEATRFEQPPVSLANAAQIPVIPVLGDQSLYAA